MSKRTVPKIQEQNDLFRRSMSPCLGCVVLTSGLAALDFEPLLTVFTAVQRFDDFTADNDPYGEHDFGAFDVDGERFFWKIDCYDLNFEFGSEDPSDPAKTRRVLTIMLAHEY